MKEKFMGLWNLTRGAVQNVVNILSADAIERRINTVAAAIVNAVTRTGNVAAAIINVIINMAKIIPIIGNMVAGFLGWIEGIVTSSFGLTAAIINTIGTISAGVLSGMMRMMTGILNLDNTLIKKSCGAILFCIGNSALLLTSKSVELVLSILSVDNIKPASHDDGFLSNTNRSDDVSVDNDDGCIISTKIQALTAAVYGYAHSGVTFFRSTNIENQVDVEHKDSDLSNGYH